MTQVVPSRSGKPAPAIALAAAAVVVGMGLLWAATHHQPAVGRVSHLATADQPPPPAVDAIRRSGAMAPTPLQLILAPSPGVPTTALDQEIIHAQKEIQRTDQPPALRLANIEKLGWLFVAQAGAQDDPGCFKLAEQCALAITAEQPDSPDAKLLLGHVLHQFHRFKEAEALARQLVAQRHLAYDFGLLGDSLMEQGRLAEAIPAYQTMLDLKPGFESFVRAAHMRWLKGDLAGAQELMGEVLGMIHPRETATVAWAEARVALYDLQAGNLPAAQRDAEIALQAKPADAPANLVLGRILSAEGRESEALDHFRLAARTRPLPEFLWALADHLEASHLSAEAAPIEHDLLQNGRRTDPRGLALYLATTKQNLPEALALAQAELAIRRDVFTWDALAWCQYANGQVAPARESMRHALAEGTQDGRLFLHAALIAGAAGDATEELAFTRQAEALKQMLLPSELRLLGGLPPAPGLPATS